MGGREGGQRRRMPGREREGEKKKEKVKGLLIQLSNCLQNLSSASRLKSGGVHEGVAKENGRGKPRNMPEAVFSPEFLSHPIRGALPMSKEAWLHPRMELCAV